MKKLKIAYYLDNFYPQVNGVVTSSVNTAFEFVRRGHEVYGIAPDFKEKKDYPNDYFPFPLLLLYGFNAFFYPDFVFTYPFSGKLLRTMKNFKPDIIHFHAPISLGYQAITNARKLNIPVIGTFHTFFAEPEYLSVINQQNNKFLQNFGWWYSNQFFNRCNAVVSPGKATANFLYQKNLNNEIHIISNGVDFQKYKNFNFNKSIMPVKIEKNEDWILFVGRISKEKCLDVLIDALIYILKKRKNVKLLIVGDGPYKNDLKKIASENNISENIHFTGSMPNKVLLESGIFKNVKLFATPSTSENQPMTILESMMFGLPVVGADAKGIPELIEGNGFLVPPHDPKSMAESILKIMENKNLYNEFSAKSIELSKKYNIRNTSDKMESLYYNVIEEYKSL